MLYTAIGGGYEVGGNCHLVQFGESAVVLDCGARPHATGRDALPDLDLVHRLTDGRIAALFISHAHRDHAGGVAEFRRRYPDTPVYASEATCDLLDVLGSSWWTDDSPQPPCAARPFGEWFGVSDGVDACLSPSGHVVGGAAVALRAGDQSLVFCSDIAVAAHRMTGVFEAPGLEAPSVMVLGAMGGDRQHDARKRMERKLIGGVSEVIQDGGSVVVVSEAFGRSQEILLALRGSMISGQAPRFPVRVAPEVARVCDALGAMAPHLAEPLRRYVENSRRDLFWTDGTPAMPDTAPMSEGAAHAWLEAGAACAIVAPPPGALSPLTEYAEAVAHDERSAVFVPESGDEEDLPPALRNALADGWLPSPDGPLSLACRVETYDVPMHADKIQLCAVVNSVDPTAVVLTHGRPEAVQALRHKLSGGRPVYTPTNGATFDPLAEGGEADEEAATPRIEIVETDDGVVVKFGADAIAQADFRRHFLGYDRMEARFDGSRMTLRPTVDRDDD